MAGQYRFKDTNGNVVAQISASAGGTISFSGSQVDFSQANTISLGEVQLAGTASNALLLDGYDSLSFTFTSSIHPFTSSVNTFTASISGTNTFTASTSARLNSIETVSGSNLARIASIETFTSSTTARLNSIEAISASNISRLNSLETHSASVDTTNSSQNSRLTSLENKTGSLASTGSNTFIGTQVITGSLYVTTDLIVQGSSSIQNITGSSVNIGTNKVVLNTANPAVRYAGISVIDSGSTGLTGSILWDSTNNNWLYQNPSGSTYTSAKFISGPQSQTLGGETGLNTGYIPKAVGDDHIGDSMIFESGSRIGLGTTQPNAMIHTTGSIWITDNPGTNALIFGSNAQGTAKYSYITSTYEGAQKVGLAIYTTSNAGTSNQERLRITDSGDVGIGSSAKRNGYPTGFTTLTIAGNGTDKAGIIELTGTRELGGNQIGMIQFWNTSGSVSEVARIQVANTSNTVLAGEIAFLTKTQQGSLADAVRITASGSVGIGFTDPQTKLDVNGTISVAFSGAGSTGTPNETVFLRARDPGQATYASINMLNSWASNNSEWMNFNIRNSSATKITAMTIYNDGNVGIATTTPGYKLEVAGTGKFTSDLYGAGDIYAAAGIRFNGSGLNASDKKLYSPTDGELQWMTHTAAGAHSFTISHQGTRYVNLDINGSSYLNGGNVGIGITNPSEKLYVNGNIYSTDTVYGKSFLPYTFASVTAGSPSGAGIPVGYSRMTVSCVCDNTWRTILTTLNDTKAYFWMTFGDAASRDTAQYFIMTTSPAYGVSNFGNVYYQDNGWNTGGFEVRYIDGGSGSYHLQIRATSYYSSSNNGSGTIYFLRME